VGVVTEDEELDVARVLGATVTLAQEALSAELRRIYGSQLHRVAGKLFGPEGLEHEADEPGIGPAVFSPPALGARSIAVPDTEVCVAASRGWAVHHYGGVLPAGTTVITVSVRAHHARTRVRLELDGVEFFAWAAALFDPEWSEFLRLRNFSDTTSDDVVLLLDPTGRPAAVPGFLLASPELA